MEAYTTTSEYPATCHNALKNDEVEQWTLLLLHNTNYVN